MDYEIIHNITRADVAVRVKGKTPEEVFIKAGKALMCEMMDDIESIKPETQLTGELRTTELELLFVQFLNEILFIKDSRGLLLLPQIVSITSDSGACLCRYCLTGETIKRGRHKFKVDVKAVTMHGLKFYLEGDTYIAETVFDV